MSTAPEAAMAPPLRLPDDDLRDVRRAHTPFPLDRIALWAVTVGVLGGFGYLFGGPVVHAVHGQGGVGAGSFLLRVGMPVMGAFLGCAIQGDSSGEFSCLGGALVGFGLGALGAVVIDASLLAYEEPQENPKKPRILTMGHATRHGGQIGIAGSF